ncbi:MAG: caspase family protein, partial [Blastocatellia bacterium]
MLTRRVLIVALATIALFSLRVAIGQERGQGVRLRIGNANTGQEVDLYSASYALVIGVSDYTNGWHDLLGVREDLPAVKAALEKHGFKVTTVLNPTRRQFDDAVGQFVGAYGQRRDTRLLIYFAGHGHTLKTQDGRRQLGYIVPADAPAPKANDTGEFKRFAVSMNEINNYAEQIEAIHALFVFDSCFAGTIFKARSGGVPEAITDKIVQPVRQFITAGNEKQTVPDYSYFRRVFVAALDGAADDSRDGFITGAELGEYLHREVTNYTKRAQTPQHGKIYNPDLNEGDLVFVAPKRESVALVEPCAKEEEAWQRVRNSRSAAVVRAFLREYPNCQYAANARVLLAVLGAPTPIESASSPAAPATSSAPAGRSIMVPDGIHMKIRLSVQISTNTNREGDKFTAVVLDPSDYAEAVVEGYISKLNRSGKATGRTELALTFDSIRLHDGRAGRFAARVERVYQSETVKTINDVGSIFIQGGKDLALEPGTEILIRTLASRGAS